MSLNLSSLFNRLNAASDTKNIQVSQNTQTNTENVFQSSNIPTSLKNILAGETLSGKIISLQDNNAVLQLSDGSEILAKLLNQDIQSGQNMTFLVTQNDSTAITLKPLFQNEQQSVLINKALDAAGIPNSDTNINIVKELLNLNMAVNTETLMDMVRYSAKFPQASLNTLATLLKLNIPIDSNSIAQLEAYKNYEHSMLSQLNSLGDSLKDIFISLNNVSDDINAASAASSIETIIQLLYDKQEVSAEGGLPLELKSQSLADIFNDDRLNNIKNMMSAFDDEALRGLADGTVTVKNFLEDLSDALKNNPALKNQLHTLINSKEFDVIINNMINETLKLNPEDVSKENAIKDYYKRIKNIIDKAENTLDSDENSSSFMKNMQSLKGNVDFMNDLNKNMTYFQMPVKFSESETNGELYVFTNKKALAARSDNVSALLHLDMDNLGPLDIYVKLSGKHVSTDFCLESEEMMDFVYSNIDKLNNRLEKLGYSVKFDMKLSDAANKFDFTNDFINLGQSTIAASPTLLQYIFDTKA